MPTLAIEHPTVTALRARPSTSSTPAPKINAETLRQLCLEAGADDVGFVEIDRAALAEERPHILAAFPATRTVMSFVCRMNREPIRSPARSLANAEFHHTNDHVTEVGHALVRVLEERDIRAVNVTAGFPMEMQNFPGRLWVLSHKIAAEAAGLGRMGIHRNVIHPRFGSFILLGSVLLEAEVTRKGQLLDYNPCLECKLCVAACPVGAIGADGHFNVSACYTHNYREFMGGFGDWVETVAESRGASDYRRRVTGPETASLWQSLSFGANYKAAYCLAVCPAGEDVAGPFLASKPQFVREIVRPLQEKPETIYVVAGSDAEAHVAKRFPAKTAKRVHSSFRLTTVAQFLLNLPLGFQPGQSIGLNAVYHFTFTGAKKTTATVTIRDRRVTARPGHHGECDLHITTDTATWFRFLGREQHVVLALITRRIRLHGPLRLFKAFGRCFPS